MSHSCTCHRLQTRLPILAITTNCFANLLYVVNIKISKRYYSHNE